ncbi:MAG: SpoIIE family protein phosphatase [Eubacterium sp.]
MENKIDYREIVELLDKQLQFAQNIQKKIIPRPSEFISDYYYLYAMLKPFRKVGGDFYDFHIFDNNKVSLVLADATGHGIDSAMITSMIKLIYSYAMRNESICFSPSKLIERIELDIEQQLTATFFSALALILDPNTNTLCFSNAGHPSALLISDAITFLKPSLPLLGLHHMMSQISYDDIVLPFKPGDKLILFTDGLIAAQSKNGDIFSIENIIDIIEKNKSLSISILCSKILKTFDSFRNHFELMDDTCLLGVEYDY